MKLDLDRNTGNTIRAVAGDEILVGTGRYRVPLIVTSERVIANWAPPGIARLGLADLDPVLALEPEVILLGTGTTQRFPPPALLATLLGRRVGIEVMNTAAACRTFNVLASEYRRVAVVLLHA